MSYALITFLTVLMFGVTTAFMPAAQAFVSPHPLISYEKGIDLLNNYRGDKESLLQAQKTFTEIIEKHPASPFGYLGMSELKIIDAYRYGLRYDMKKIRDEAMPMALKAMRTGPTLHKVHHHYDRFEKIFKNNDENQDHARRLLFLFPERSDTYINLADYLVDQGDYDKAIEYYHVAIKFADSQDVKLKALQRIAHVYDNDLYDPKRALEYYESALLINEHLPAVWQSMGEVYLKLKRYDLSVVNFQKAFDVFRTPQLQTSLLQAKSFLYESMGDLNLAIAIINDGLENNKQNTALHRHLANLYYKKNDFTKAFFHFQKVILAGLAGAEDYYYAGRCADSIGRKQLAKGLYEQYLLLKSEGEEAEWIRRNIPDLSHR